MSAPTTRAVLVAALAATGALALACDPGARATPDAGGGTTPDAAAPAAPCDAVDQAEGALGCEFWAADLGAPFEDVHGHTFGTPPCGFLGAELVRTRACVSGDWASGLCDLDDDCSETPFSTCQTVIACAHDAQRGPFAIVVVNPDASAPVQVTVADGGHSVTRTVAPGAAEVFVPSRLGFVDHSLEHGGVVAEAAFHIVADRPVAAFQMLAFDDPYDDAGAATRLLPVRGLAAEYRVVGFPSVRRRPHTHDDRATITVIATAEGTTRVELTPAAPLARGVGVPALGAGVPAIFALQRGDVLNVELAGWGDPTGSKVLADRPVAVFVGHEGARLTTPGAEFVSADPLAEQLPPPARADTQHVVARSPRRELHEKDHLRIVPLLPGALVTIEPPVATCAAAGDAAFVPCDIDVDTDVVITSTMPVLVAHVFAGSGADDAQAGDPAMVFETPSSRWARRHDFALPEDWARLGLTVAAPLETVITVDGVAVTTPLERIGQSTYGALRLPTAPGVHRVECQPACGVNVYGWDGTAGFALGGATARRGAQQ